MESPIHSKNVGSVCRAMKNMGLSRLYIAGKTRINREEAAITAIHASKLLDTTVYCSNLAEALEGTVFSAALSRRRGRKRKFFSIYPDELAGKVLSIREGDVALVFGNEVSGLCEDDMNLCNIAVKIPVNEEFPSLNLSHAVQVTAYEIYKKALCEKNGHKQEGYSPVSREELDKLTDSMTENLKEIGFYKLVSPDEMGDFFRDIFARASLSRKEADRMKKIFLKIRGLVNSKQ